MSMLEEKLFPILAELLSISAHDLNITTKAEEIETWDSLAIINIALAIESEFDLSLTPEQIAEFNSVEYIYNSIKESTE